MKILVCEDDPSLLRMVVFNLAEQKLGEVVGAKNGRDGMELLRRQNFDLVITDIHMPHHNGEDLLKLLRQEQKKNTPIIMISSDGDEDVVAAAKKQGANEFVKKPIKMEELSKQVKRLLKI